MKCPKCGKDVELQKRQIGLDDNGEPIINEFAICRDCKKKWNLDKQRQKKTAAKPEVLQQILPGFVLCAAGIGCICISIFHVIIDVLGWIRWSLPLRVVGMNALAAYVVTHLVSLHMLSARMLSGTWALILPAEWVRVANAAVALLLGWLLCYFLYCKRVFIKL